MFRRRFVLLMLICAAWTAQAHASQRTPSRAPVLPSVPSRFAGPQEVESASTNVLQSDNSLVRLLVTAPEVRTESAQIDGIDFTALRIQGEAVTETPGAPEVPRIVRLIMVGAQGSNILSSATSTYRTLTLPHGPAPYVPLEEADQSLDEDVPLVSPEFYEANQWYPREIAEISEEATFRDLRFVILTVYPLQVNPVTGEVRIHETVDVSIQNIGGVGVNELQHTPQSLSPAFKELYRTIPNFEGSGLDELPVVPGKHLYVCDPNATIVNTVTNLVNWRRKRGIDAYIATTTDIGANTAAAIRSYILNEYASSNGTLEAVTLIGDPNAAAPYNLATGVSNQLDNFFATMGGGNPDPVPDLSVGRLPATSSGELGTMINSIISYESDPYMVETDWYDRAWCAAHTSQVPSNPSTKQYMRQIMLQHGMPTVDFDVFSSGMNATTLATRLNAGVCVFNDRMSWIGEFNATALSGVNVGEQLPYVWVVTCATGTFDDSFGDQALTEAFMTEDEAIGCVGMSGAGTHTRFNNILDGGGMQTIFAYDIRETGMAVIGAKLELYKNFYSIFPSNVSDFSAWCNLQGDPGVPVYLARPKTLEVTHPVTVTRGTNNVGVIVESDGLPVTNALVGLTKGTETFARGYTDENGEINLPVGLPTTGTLDIVVTGKDLLPYVSTINVINVAASLSYSSSSLTGDPSPGQIVSVNIVLQNTGTSQTVTGITGTLTSASPNIGIVNGVRSYPNLTVGATSGPTSPFTIAIGSVADNEPIALFLNMTSSAGSQVIRVDVTPASASVVYVSSSFPDGNNQIEPGETGNLIVTMQNNGSRSFTGATAILRSLNNYVTVTDADGTFGTVNAGANATNAANPFGVSALVATPRGFQAMMELVVLDANGNRDSTNFLLPVGTVSATAPTGPDSYGYLAYENSDTQPANSQPQFEWIEICPALGGTGQSLGFTDGGEDQDDIATRVLPFSFQFYGQQFDTITICSNGWVAFGNTTQIDYRNFHMGSPLGPPNMIAAFWDDLVVDSLTNGGVYVKSDAANGRYIIEWITRCIWAGVGTAPQTFQVVLYDPAVEPSQTGDGKILVQYLDYTEDPNDIGFDNYYSTVGIQNENHTDGLEITYWNAATPGSTPLADGRAILFTTDFSGAINPHFALISPNGGELWLQDSTVSVIWSPALVTGNVNIELSRNGLTGPWSPIVLNTPNDGQHSFVASGPQSESCRVRITSVNTPDSTDVSAGDFTIAAVVVLTSENFDTGAPGWTHTSPGGWGDQWHISMERALSGASSYKCGDTGTGTYANLLDAQLTSPVISNLPASAVLEFSHQIEGELSTQYPDSAYDGGWVEISADAGPFTSIYPSEDYPKTTRHESGSGNPYSGPVPGQDCYSGTVDAWTREQFDLSAYEGSNIQLRWRFASDGGATREGWYIDDVSVYGIAAIPQPVMPIGVTISISGNDVVLRWSADENVAYRVYSSTSSTPPFLTIEGETSNTEFTITDGALSPQMFYYVVGWNGQ
ncbi:MAG: immune inhibitor A [Calditrichaeota bacterium]|nr:immune inhibitor A [Calditrichota bacterium]MCB9391099.1 immune inhibitor A [Calditrichota bacterium]